MQKIAMIFIISFVKIGPVEVHNSNSAFLCFIILSLSFWGQLKTKPFLTDDFNDFNLRATVLMMVSLFFGLFCTLSQDQTIQYISFIVLLAANIIFFANFIKAYMIIQISTLDEKSALHSYINKIKFLLKSFYFNYLL